MFDISYYYNYLFHIILTSGFSMGGASFLALRRRFIRAKGFLFRPWPMRRRARHLNNSISCSLKQALKCCLDRYILPPSQLLSHKLDPSNLPYKQIEWACLITRSQLSTGQVLKQGFIYLHKTLYITKSCFQLIYLVWFISSLHRPGY